MNEVEDVQPGHIYQPGNKKEVRLVYRIMSGPYCGRHQKSFSLTKWGPAGAWAAAREAKAFMLDTGRLPPFFASPYSRSRLTNASANGVPRGYLGEAAGVPGSSDSEDIATPPTATREAPGISSPVVRVAGPKRSQRRARRLTSVASLPSGGAAAPSAAGSPDLSSAASAVEALLSFKNSKDSLFTTLPKGADLLSDPTSLQLLALGCQQQLQQQHGAPAAANNNAIGGACGASFAAHPQTALDLAALSFLSAGCASSTEGQQQLHQQLQQSSVKDAALLLHQMQQMGQLDILKLLGQVGGAVGGSEQQQQEANSRSVAAGQEQQQQSWGADGVDAQLLSLPLKGDFSCQESTLGSRSSGLSGRDTSAGRGLDAGSLELSNLVAEPAIAADSRPSRRDSSEAAEPGGMSFHKDKELLLNFLATADNAQRHRQQQQQQHQQQQQQPQGNVIDTLSSLVTLLETMRKKESEEQSGGGKFQRQEQQPTLEQDCTAALLQQRQQHKLQAGVWQAPSVGDLTGINANDKSFSDSLMRFLQKHPSEEDATGMPVTLATTQTPEGLREPFSFMDNPTCPGVCSRQTGRAEGSGSSNASTGSSSPKTVATKVSRRPSDASTSPAAESGASPNPEQAGGPAEILSTRRKAGMKSELLPLRRRDATGAFVAEGCTRRGSLDQDAGAAVDAGLVGRDGCS